MSDNSVRTPLGTIEAFEAAAFHVGQVARQLLAEHPGLPAGEVRPFVIAHPRPESMRVELEISTFDCDAVSMWAEALGTTADVRFHDHQDGAAVYEFHQALKVISGVQVSICATRRPTPQEIAAWRDRPEQAASEQAGGAL